LTHTIQRLVGNRGLIFGFHVEGKYGVTTVGYNSIFSSFSAFAKSLVSKHLS